MTTIEHEFTKQDRKDLAEYGEAFTFFKEQQAKDIQALEASHLSLDYSHHWAWNNETKEIEYASHLKKYADNKPARKAPVCLNCGANPRKRRKH